MPGLVDGRYLCRGERCACPGIAVLRGQDKDLEPNTLPVTVVLAGSREAGMQFRRFEVLMPETMMPIEVYIVSHPGVQGVARAVGQEVDAQDGRRD